MPDHNTNNFPSLSRDNSIPISAIILSLTNGPQIPPDIQSKLDQPINTDWNQFITDRLQIIYTCQQPLSWNHFKSILLDIGFGPQETEIIIEDWQSGTYQDLIDTADYIFENKT